MDEAVVGKHSAETRWGTLAGLGLVDIARRAMLSTVTLVVRTEDIIVKASIG